ncbi:MAG: hypothetical protein J6Y31_00490 [Bacteroidales bacterium]|nr:hypothetical protein [Bacteroidales bacterium]
MDIDLLAKMVKELILDADAVTLPGVGSFVAELVPASFSDKGYTIHPPYRRLSFTPREGSDTLLTDLYASSNDISQDDASAILGNYLAEMKEVLKQRKSILFPGLGRLRATRENHFFFVADEDLDIFPAGFGLEPVSLKSHSQGGEEVKKAAAAISGILEQPVAPEAAAMDLSEGITEVALETAGIKADDSAAPVEVPEDVIDEAPAPESVPEVPEPAEGLSEEPAVEEPVVEEPATEPVPEPADGPSEEPVVEEPVVEEPAPEVPEPAEGPSEEPAVEEPVVEEPATEPTSEPVPEPAEPAQAPAAAESPRRKGGFVRALLICLIIITSLAIVALVFLRVAGAVAPDWLDGFLYSADELEILHGQS